MYWTRVGLKEKAKAVLKTKYWMLFVISLILSFAAGGSGAGSLSVNISNLLDSNSNDTRGYEYDYGYDYEYGGESAPWEDYRVPQGGILSERFLTLIILIAFIVVLLGLLVRVLVGYNLSVGCFRYFIGTAQGFDMQFGALGATFKKGLFFNVVKTLLLRDVLLSLWTFLPMIPGVAIVVFGALNSEGTAFLLGLSLIIISPLLVVAKTLSYLMAPYILADNPHLPPTRVLAISKAMMHGEKWPVFVLGLSFLGWTLLGILACCIGVIFLQPYVEATYAQLYLFLREQAIENGYTTAEELNLVPEPVEPERQNQFFGNNQN